MIRRRRQRWHYPRLGDLPTFGGTYAVIHLGEPRWFYFNVGTGLFHPPHGWRRKVGVPMSEIEAWIGLPEVDE